MEARVTKVRRTNFILTRADGSEIEASIRGQFHESGDFPRVGDYVAYDMVAPDQAVIEHILPRRSTIVRKSAESDEPQVIAANVDLILIVMGLDHDFNPSRLERYLLLAEQSAIPASVILNKSDVAEDFEAQVALVRDVSGDMPVFAISALSGEGLGAVRQLFSSDTTAVLLGSSGAGKSTITNRLLGEELQAVKEVRADDGRGRHTTTSRQLFPLPGGGSLIDTPGMRELGVLEIDTKDAAAVFAKIDVLAAQCRFRNCDHEKSAGCAVQAALVDGTLTEREFASYQKLTAEQALLSSKSAKNADRHTTHNEKRAARQAEIVRRDRLRRGL